MFATDLQAGNIVLTDTGKAFVISRTLHTVTRVVLTNRKGESIVTAKDARFTVIK